jgi:predicted glycogen debranching enzyme
MMTFDDRTEWLEADGLGGFASGTASGLRTRRYHALLLTATTPPTGRMVLVNGLDAWATTPAGRFALSTQRYRPDVLHPDGHSRLTAFTCERWPAWEFVTPDGARIVHEILTEYESGRSVLTWRVNGPVPVKIEVRLLLSGRDYHSTHHENAAFRFEPDPSGAEIVWRPYEGVPAVQVVTNGDYRHAPEWYRSFLYSAERERGLDDTEDLASPGVLSWDLGNAGEAALVLSAGDRRLSARTKADALARAQRIRASEDLRRATFATPIDRAADAYLVRRGNGRTIVAGYPWFTDWGRDTFIAIRGLCIATGRLSEARAILLEWAGAVSEGMLPNRFPDSGEAPEFNAVDASLWYIVAVHELLEAATADRDPISDSDRARLENAVQQILEGYAAGTRYGIRADADGLLAAGEPGVQLTWMDAKVGDRVITPRIGKPVDVQALWVNALWVGAQFDTQWTALLERGRRSFSDRFWNAERGCLFDVVDVDHVAGATDSSLRPNQVLAVGGLPVCLLDLARARQVIDVVERELLTPIGLRSLASSEREYVRRYEGSPAERDAAYHQGTVWPWLLGPFVEGWVRARGGSAAARRQARKTFLAPLLEKLDGTFGHLAEIADADAPFTPRGCPFQAWSLGEVLRLDRKVLASPVRRRAQMAASQ